MDTRQLTAFCAVVERRSFSQAAERLGVTQPAVSLQVRALEKRLGTQLLDRSGRRVEPTEAGRRLFRGAQRLLQLEEQLLDEIAAEGEGELDGRALDRRLDRAGRHRRARAAVRVPAPRIPAFASRSRCTTRRPSSTSSPTASSSSASSARPAGTGAVRFEPFLRDEVILICPPGHPFAGRTVSVDELRDEALIVMQEGAGVRQVVEDELRRLGVRLRDLDVQLELGLQESVRSAVQAGYGVTFISRTAVESDLAAGTLAEARLDGMDATRGDLARPRGRQGTRARGVRRVRACSEA